MTTFLLTFLQSGVAACTIAIIRGAFGARSRWIAARIVLMRPQHSFDDHLPSFPPRKSSAAAT